jgi:signal transduction histidine kinase
MSVYYSIAPLVVGALLSTGLIVFAWRRRPAPGTISLIALMLAVTLWTIGYMLELATVDPDAKLIWATFKYAGIVVVPVFWLTFALEYTGQIQWVTRRTLLFLLITPALTLLLSLTNEAHHLMWNERSLIIVNSLSLLKVAYGVWFWVHAAYSYILLLVGSVVLVRKLLRSSHIYRGQLMVLLIAVAAPWLANALAIFDVTLIDLTPFAFTLTGLMIAWALFRFELFDLVPVARDLILEDMSDGFVVVNQANRVVDLNPAAELLLGVSADKAIGQGAPSILPRVTDKPDLYTTPGTAQAVALGERYVDVRVSPLHDRRRNITGHLLVFHDVTERQRNEARIQAQNEALVKANHELAIARREAEEATQLKSQFLATMSHELRTPLNAIIGYTEIQLAGMTGNLTEEQKDYQQRILRNAGHLLQLINEVLDLSKIEAGRFEVVEKPFAVSDLLNDVVYQTKGLLVDKTVRMETSLDDTLPSRMLGDYGRLKQIMINLVSNAIKFTDQGSVHIDIKRSETNKWSIIVSDTGAGIPSHALEYIFEEFRQVDGGSQRKHGGTGLGLAIVRKLILLMNGSIRVKSQVGEGSTFTVTLPLLEAEPVPQLL